MSIYLTRADEMLATHGISRTRPRVLLLKYLAQQARPITAAEMLEKLSGEIDEATLYRSLAKFKKNRIVIRYDFGCDHAYYELAAEKPHHHHAVCESCGLVADIRARDDAKLNQRALADAPDFSRFTRHSLEFYGVCKGCASLVT